MPLFEGYIGIDYSGAATAESSLKGIRVFAATPLAEPNEVTPSASSARKYWSRRATANWLREELSSEVPSIVGIDHAFSFPLAYFEKQGFPENWSGFLDDFQHRCPTDQENTHVDCIRDGIVGSWNYCAGEPDWFRLTEDWTTSAKSVFRFDVQGAVAKATYAGLPWLRYLRNECVGEDSLLAIRRVGCPCEQVSAGGSLSVAVDETLSTPEPEWGSARGLLSHCLAAPCRPEPVSSSLLSPTSRTGGA